MAEAGFLWSFRDAATSLITPTYHPGVDFPDLSARTRRFTHGAPRAVTVANDGSRVVFLRSGGPQDPADALWSFDVASTTERLIADPAVLTDGSAAATAIGSYQTDPKARVAAFVLAGRLFRADLMDGNVVEVPTVGPATDAQPDPTGERIAYVVDNQLRVVDYTGTDMLLAGEDNGIRWARPDPFVTRSYGLTRGYWWAPDGQSILAIRIDGSRLPRWHLPDGTYPDRDPTVIAYPRAGGPMALVSLHLLDLDGGWVDVHWDRETYPYLVSVDWTEGVPLITVLRRLQQHGLVLAVDPRTGETQVHAELADPRWVDPIPGTPCHLPDGRVLVGGELAHDGYDARCLFADGTLITSPSLYVRRVVGRLSVPAGPPDLLIEASEGDPSQQHLFQVRTALGLGGVEARRLTADAGWHTGVVGGNVLVIGSQSLDHSGTHWTVWQGDRQVAMIRSLATPPPYAPRPVLDRVTDRRLPAAVLYPRNHVTGRRLPVLLDVYGGPGRQEVLAARSRWLIRQWWADAGFAVVTVDNRGTPGVAPSFEKVVHRRLADLVLADQIDALAALADKHPDLDLDRVAIRGRHLGGWLAGLAVLRRPDLFRCAIARAPLTDWALYDALHAERYLGLPDDAADVYTHHSLIDLVAEAPKDPARPILLVHGLADDEVVAAHTLRLSAALLSAARPHAVLPLADGDVATESLLPLELDFLRRHL